MPLEQYEEPHEASEEEPLEEPMDEEPSEEPMEEEPLEKPIEKELSEEPHEDLPEEEVDSDLVSDSRSSQMSNKYFAEYTGIEVKQFRDTLLQLMGNVKKSVAKKTRHQRQYEKRVNKRHIQMQESKIDTGKAVDANLVITKSSGTESEVQDDSNMSGNDTDAGDADIRPIYDEKPMDEVQLTVEGDIFTIEQQHTKQIEISHEEQTTSLLANNADLKAQIQEKVFAIAALKNGLRKSKGNSVDTKFAKTSVLRKLVLQPLRNQSVVRQSNAFKSERPKMLKPRFASQVDVEKDLSKPVTQHYLPKRRESTFAKTDHMISSSSSRNSHRFSPIKTSVVYEKTSPRSDLSMGRIFKIVGLRWIPIGKLLDSCTSKDDSEPTHGSNVGIPNIHECKQTLDISTVGKLFSHLFDEYFNGENQVVSKSSAIHTADASDKLQQQPYSTSSTSTLATVTADGNFDLYKQRCYSLILAESNSLPHAHAQTTKTYYKHQDSRIKKAQDLKIKTSANSDIQDLPLRCQVYQGRLLASFQDDAKLVPSCFAIFDLEPLLLSLNFVFTSKIFKSLSFSLDRLCRLAILCLDQHAHTLHHLE
nr:hypothetical protein [Tanacetum cinerariifolium]